MAGEQGGWSYGEPFGGLPPMTLPLLGGGDAVQGRSQLRKRDFESELLERLLSHGNRGGIPLPLPHRIRHVAVRGCWHVFAHAT